MEQPMTSGMEPNELTALISAADRPADEVAAAIATAGPDRVVDTLLAEIAARTRAIGGAEEKVGVRFELSFDTDRVVRVVTAGSEVWEIGLDQEDEPLVTIRQDLVELLRAVFATGGPHHATRDMMIADSAEPHGLAADDPWLRRRRAAVLTAHQVVEATYGRFTDLTRLAVAFDADKWGGHWYTPHYQRYFEPLRDQQVKVLEIGIGGYDDPALGGASLRMWKHYFRRGQIYGLDIFLKEGIAEPRLHTVRGDQGDPEFLRRFAAEFGPFDIVVDDGSHFSEHVRTSFQVLFPHVRPGGRYAIEDTQSSYWPGWGGSSDLAASGTSMAMVKALLDGLNHQEQIRPEELSPTAVERTVTAVHAHHNLVVIEKGSNAEQGAPVWVPKTVDPRTWYAGR
jgi:hypothetical protein